MLANKASGNSGKIETIEFLAKQKKSLQGIVMSSGANVGQVYLCRLDVSKEKFGRRIDLRNAKFEDSKNFDSAVFKENYIVIVDYIMDKEHIISLQDKFVFIKMMR